MSQHPYYSAQNDSDYGKPASIYENDAALSTSGHSQTLKKGGATQPKRCNDVIWAILFFINLGIMAWVAYVYAPQMYSDLANNYNSSGNGGQQRRIEGQATNEYGSSSSVASIVTVTDVLLLLSLTAVISLVAASLALSFMMHFAQGLIKVALVFNVITTGLFATFGALTGQLYAAIVEFLLFGLTVYYACVVWNRIPFAACNMTTAVTAVRANIGITFFAYSSVVVLLGWNLWFATAFGSYLYVNRDNLNASSAGNNGAGGAASQGNYQSATISLVVFLFLISYYWGHQVVKNHLHVTVAGTVGTWWFVPAEASSCCSSAVRDSFFRASTFSFGSICFGSLIVAIIQAIREMTQLVRDQGDNILLCLAECLLSCIESLAEYFNQWAYVYVALYGYSFVTAGKNVITLFQERGWTTIITDNLIDRVLLMMSFLVGLIMGLVTTGIAAAQGIVVIDDAGTYLVPFLIGAFIGFLLTSILMNVVGSAVNTIIVCYAEAPNEFQLNHPQLSVQMRNAWRQAWPDEFHY